MARAFAYLFGIGGTLVFLTIPLDNAHDRYLPGMIVPPLGAYAVVALMLWRFDRLPLRLFSVLPGAGTVLASLVVLSGGAEAIAEYAMFYFWVVLSAFYFFPREVATAQLVLVGICLAAVLLLKPEAHDPVLLWLMAMGTLTVAGTLIRLLSERMQHIVAQLDNAARTDPLTGLLNRRGLAERMDLELARTRRTKQPIAVIVADLDHFKRMNDRYGHEAGDETLTHVADIMRLKKRAIDAAARTGGEEFVLVLPDTDTREALALAERIRLAIRDAYSDHPLAQTISMGVAAFPQNGGTLAEVSRAADAALYEAKLGGRDRSVLAAPNPGESSDRDVSEVQPQ